MSQKPEYFGKYILLEKLATGGMAEVYLAKSTGAENVAKFFAIKRILPQFSTNSEFVEMFKEEAKIAINLNHGNIVTIIEFGEENKQFYLVMEYVEGRNLRQVINKIQQSDQKFRIDHVVYIMKEVALGLDHAHRCVEGSTGRPLNISHRDISPQNVMINFEGEVKICDFGIAKAESKLEHTQAGTLKGKFGYMSPEQAEGQEVDYRTDIFSLGIVMWELLAQDRLFLANNEMNTLRKIRDCQIPSLRKIDPNIPAELERITNRALAKDRNIRYQSCSDIYRELSRFLARHFPDFSSHDFSTFIKQIYAKEREENRQRVIEFGKVKVNPPSKHSKFVQNSDFTKTVTDPSADDIFGKSRNSAISIRTDARAILQKEPSSILQNSDIFSHQNPKIDRQKFKERDEALLRKSNQNQQQSTSTKSLSYYDAGQTSRSSSVRIEGDRLQTKQSSSKLAGLMIVAAVAAIFTWYFKIYPEKFTKIQSDVHEMVGDVKGSQAVQDIKNSTTQIASNGKVKVFVVSNPPEAEVRINDTATGVYTPGQIDLPVGEAVQVSLHKEGYLTWYQDLNLTSSTDIKTDLTKADFGYVDIFVRAGDGTVYVDGRKLSQKPPIISLPIPAGRPVKVKAVDLFLKTTDEKTLIVRKDTKLTVYLFLKKTNEGKPAGDPKRIPSNR